VKTWKNGTIDLRPSSGLGEAVKCIFGQWDKILNYLDCPYLTPDNNTTLFSYLEWLFEKALFLLDDHEKLESLLPFNCIPEKSHKIMIPAA